VKLEWHLKQTGIRAEGIQVYERAHLTDQIGSTEIPASSGWANGAVESLDRSMGLWQSSHSMWRFVPEKPHISLAKK
jgi:hypothetical protein